MEWMSVSGLATITVPVAIGAGLVSFRILQGRRRVHARLGEGGFQEMEIVVKGGYVPDVIEVRRGIPVRLYFRREEDTPCSQRVIFSEFHVSSTLPAYQTTPVCFIPTRCGEFLFTCAFGMYVGRLVVREPADRFS